MWPLIAIIAFLAGYGLGRRLTSQEMRVLEISMEQLERIQTEDL